MSILRTFVNGTLSAHLPLDFLRARQKLSRE